MTTIEQERRLTQLGERVIGAWNSQDVDGVLACYTDDLVYLDPNTDGPVEGTDAMRRYLEKLFSEWQMTWETREVFSFAGGDGAAVLWRATLASKSGGPEVEANGMDLVLLDGDLISRNEVYFDRSALA